MKIETDNKDERHGESREAIARAIIRGETRFPLCLCYCILVIYKDRPTRFHPQRALLDGNPKAIYRHNADVSAPTYASFLVFLSSIGKVMHAQILSSG